MFGPRLNNLHKALLVLRSLGLSVGYLSFSTFLLILVIVLLDYCSNASSFHFHHLLLSSGSPFPPPGGFAAASKLVSLPFHLLHSNSDPLSYPLQNMHCFTVPVKMKSEGLILALKTSYNHSHNHPSYFNLRIYSPTILTLRMREKRTKIYLRLFWR